MPCAVNETTAVPATAASERHHPDAAPDILAEEAGSTAEQLASVSEPRGHETQKELTSANRSRSWGSYRRRLPKSASRSALSS